MNTYVFNIVLGIVNTVIGLSMPDYFAAAGWVCSVLGWAVVYNLDKDK